MISPRVLLHTQSDAALAALAAGGSERAFETLVRRHRRALLTYSRRLVGADGVAEDIVEQALLAAWRALAVGTEVRDVRAWLYRITHNQAMTALRRVGGDEVELSDTVAPAVPTNRDLEARLRAGETLAALPQLQREAIVLTVLDGRSQHDAAAALGVSDDAVRGLVYRARASLRTRLAAVVPGPAILWAAARGRGGTQTWPGPGPGVTETLTAGSSAGGAAIVVKAAAVLASSAAVVGGTVGLTDRRGATLGATHSARPATRARASSATTPRRPNRSGRSIGDDLDAGRRARVHRSRGDRFCPCGRRDRSYGPSGPRRAPVGHRRSRPGRPRSVTADR